ncbi:kelch-like protein 12 [Stylophora pistillata]|uniref:kelch-like protein 12 n=1 Tax=Stylophora pistillata TaxID=50429 RepID=UPI000C03F0FE|nr:kelch-like protein 12 [Stylophora pistillata]
MTKATDKLQYCVDLVAKLDDFRQQKVLCDITLVTAERTFLAHRNVLAAGCPYFYKLFTSDMKEKGTDYVDLSQMKVTANALEPLLTYFYAGTIEVTQSNAEELFITADYLLIPEVKLGASARLVANVNVSNCLYYFDLAERYNCTKLSQACRVFIDKHFQEVTQSQDFLKLDIEQITHMISSDDICVENEEAVYESLITWISYHQSEREVYFPKLLTCIRFGSMSHEYLQSQVVTNSLVQGDSSCVKLVENAMKRNHSSGCVSLQNPRKCLQPEIDVVVAISGLIRSSDTQSTSVRCYVPEEDNWFEMKHFPNQINWHGFAEYKSELYTVGGERNGIVSKALEKFDLKTNRWETMSSMLKEVLFPAVAFLGNCLYVIGASRGHRGTLQIYIPSMNIWTLGTDLNVPREVTCAIGDGQFLYAIGGMRAGNGEYLNSAEKYDPELDIWTDISPMTHPRGGTCAVSYKSSIFVMGGECTVRVALSTCEVYSTTSDQWQSIAPMHVPRYFAGAAIVGKKIYVFGGVGGSNVDLEKRKMIDRYDIEQDVWNTDITIPWEAKYLRCCSFCVKRDFLQDLQMVTD